MYDELLSQKIKILAGKKDNRKLKRINAHLTELSQTLTEREKLLQIKERELRESKVPEDIVYRLRYLDRLKVKKISKIIHYSDTQTYRIIQNINTVISQDGRE